MVRVNQLTNISSYVTNLSGTDILEKFLVSVTSVLLDAGAVKELGVQEAHLGDVGG